MANLVHWIEEEAGGEPIEAAVIGEMGWGDFGSGAVPKYSEIPKGVILSWKEAIEWLDYEFDEGVGTPGGNAIYVWTQTKVISVYQHDGATGLYSIPRNPTAIMPKMVGG